MAPREVLRGCCCCRGKSWPLHRKQLGIGCHSLVSFKPGEDWFQYVPPPNFMYGPVRNGNHQAFGRCPTAVDVENSLQSCNRSPSTDEHEALARKLQRSAPHVLPCNFV